MLAAVQPCFPAHHPRPKHPQPGLPFLYGRQSANSQCREVGQSLRPRETVYSLRRFLAPAVRRAGLAVTCLFSRPTAGPALGRAEWRALADGDGLAAGGCLCLCCLLSHSLLLYTQEGRCGAEAQGPSAFSKGAVPTTAPSGASPWLPVWAPRGDPVQSCTGKVVGAPSTCPPGQPQSLSHSAEHLAWARPWVTAVSKTDGAPSPGAGGPAGRD